MPSLKDEESRRGARSKEPQIVARRRNVSNVIQTLYTDGVVFCSLVVYIDIAMSVRAVYLRDRGKGPAGSVTGCGRYGFGESVRSQPIVMAQHDSLDGMTTQRRNCISCRSQGPILPCTMVIIQKIEVEATVRFEF